uniref:DNA ligase (NAD(+)) n=1 Tax=viral metagenome TaxID=1070528 RepID=A0A6C0CGV0_9ZZZZ
MEVDYKSLNKKQLVEFLLNADKYYYNTGEPLITDDRYDEIKEHLRAIDKKNAYFKRVGADVDNKVKLPYYLGSQDKIKDDSKILNKWIAKYNDPKSYIISEKLDGISCLVVYKSGDIKIYTRGDGYYGQDITHIKDYINGIISTKIQKHDIVVRGELIISRENWEKIKHEGSNARNLVAGLINSKILKKDLLKFIDFIVYEIIEGSSTNLDDLKKFNVVKHKEVKDISIDFLYNLYKDWKEKSKYEIDGLIVKHNSNYKLKAGENPKYSFAFKSLNMQKQVEVVVNDIEWNISKDKYLKPIVKFNEIVLNGVKIKQATGFNADFIVKNKIGVGSRIVIIRSGDVIPHITEVLSPSLNNKPLMPDLPFIWNKKDIILDDIKKNREQDIKIFSSFMKSLNIKGIGEGIITKLYDTSYDTLEKIITISKDDLLKIDGIKEKSANNIIEALKDIYKKNCLEIMFASNILGRGLGERKLKLLIDAYPYICENQEKALKLTKEDIIKIDGFGDITADAIIKNLKAFLDFYNSIFTSKVVIKKDEYEDNKEELINDKYKDNTYVFSGIRDKKLEKIIIASGGKIGNIVNKKTTLLIVKSLDDATVKVETAKKYNIPIITFEKFIK